jgi:RNA polymerase sigma-70 factor (ECF subfamily)
MANQTTCWTLIRDAAAGGGDQRAAFATRYQPLIRAFLGARWKNSSLSAEIEDACQDFFVDCFREGGPLDRVEATREGGFRPFLYGIVRIIALRWEERAGRQRARPMAKEYDVGQIESDETRLSQVFDRAWARTVMEEAGQRHEQQAKKSGQEAMQRVELLRLRFREGLAIREIAKLWDTDPDRLHYEYRKARDEYSQTLYEVVQFHNPGATADQINRECLQLLTVLK